MKKVMALVAHADDESLGAGGYISKLVATKHSVSVVIVSDGIVRARGKRQNNKKDVSAACKILGVRDVHFLNFKDQKFDIYPIADIANEVSKTKLNPDLIITHVETDLNKDHRIVTEVAKIVGRPKNKPITILGCEVPNTSSWNAEPFKANFYVDISHTIDKKIKAFSAYRNELMTFPHPWSEKGLRILAQFRGMEAGCEYAEAYQVIRMFESVQ